MSTPSKEEVEGRRVAALALEEWARAIRELGRVGEGSFRALSTATMRHGDALSGPMEAARILAVLRMLEPLQVEARDLADLWGRVAGHEAAAIRADEENDRLNALEDARTARGLEPIRPVQRMPRIPRTSRKGRNPGGGGPDVAA